MGKAKTSWIPHLWAVGRLQFVTKSPRGFPSHEFSKRKWRDQRVVNINRSLTKSARWLRMQTNDWKRSGSSNDLVRDLSDARRTCSDFNLNRSKGPWCQNLKAFAGDATTSAFSDRDGFSLLHALLIPVEQGRYSRFVRCFLPFLAA